MEIRNFVRGHRAVLWLWEASHREFAHLNFCVLENSQVLILLYLTEQFLALCILQRPEAGAHRTAGLQGSWFLKGSGHNFV